MVSANLSRNPLRQVDESSVHPVLPKHANRRRPDAGTERRHVRLNHAERSVDGPEEEEDDEHVVSIPKSLVVGASRLLN